MKRFNESTVTILGPCQHVYKQQVLSAQMEVHFQGAEKCGSQAALFKLQLYIPYSCVGRWLFFIGEINAHFHVKVF